MSDDGEGTADDAGELPDDRQRAVDELGRRAGAALRRPPPPEGVAQIRRTARNRRIVRLGGATVAVLAIVTLGIAVVARTDDDDQQPIDRPADIVSTTVSTAPTTASAPTTSAETSSTEPDTGSSADAGTTTSEPPTTTVDADPTTTEAGAPAGVEEPSPSDDPTVVATVSNEWIAFAAGSRSRDIYLVQEGSPARRITGSVADGADQICPSFAPDGTRLVYGQANGTYASGFRDVALVVADVSAAGDVTTATTIALDGLFGIPCATWSPDGRAVAIGCYCSADIEEGEDDQVWIVDVETEEVRRIPAPDLQDVDWAPDATELAIVSGEAVFMYSLATDDATPLPDSSGISTLAWSPDGTSFVVSRDGALWLMNADGSDQRVLTADLTVFGGTGPVWSPDGTRIAYQRSCAEVVDPAGVERSCSDVHPGLGASLDYDYDKAVVIPATNSDPLGPLGSVKVIPPPKTAAPDATREWYPASVTWSPDGSTLLYLAWAKTEPPIGLRIEGVVAVPVDGATPPVVLHEEVGSLDPIWGPWNPSQSWARRPG